MERIGDGMEIIAKCKYDYETVKAMAHIGLYKKRNPKKQFLSHTLYCIGLIITVIVLMIIWGSDGYEGEAEVEYSIISKVMETSKYFFIYQKNNQAYIIDKTKIVQGTVQDIKSRFIQFAGIEYIVCNY